MGAARFAGQGAGAVSRAAAEIANAEMAGRAGLSGQGGAITYHGTPHRFPPTAKNPLGEFDPMKIGTGEGAQAYGAGAGYLAENRGVAKGYQEAVTRKLFDTNSILGWGESKVQLSPGDVGMLFKEARETLTPIEAAKKLKTVANSANAYSDKTIADVITKIREQTKGNLYKVDLPDEQIAKMLDWDKPLSQQSAEVQKAFPHFSTPEAKALTLEGRNLTQQANDLFAAGKLDEAKAVMNRAVVAKARMLGAMGRDEMTGQSLHAQIQSMLREPAKELGPGAYDFGSKATSEMLRELGIPGIRYLDQGSRGAGQGTSNFVVFDPKHMNIIGRE